jgi:hypothetical protein
MLARVIPAVAFASADAEGATAAPPGSLSTVSKNVTSSAEVRTARTPIPSAPHASMTARRVRDQPPGWPDPGLTAPEVPGLTAPACPGLTAPACPGLTAPEPTRPPDGRCASSHTAESRSTHRNSPVPGRSDRSLDRSEKYSRSPGRNSRRETRPGEPGCPGSGKRSSGSGHATACAGSSRAAVTLAASCDSRKPQRSPIDANGLRPRRRSRVISYGIPSRSLQASAVTVRTDPSTHRSSPITER